MLRKAEVFHRPCYNVAIRCMHNAAPSKQQQQQQQQQQHESTTIKEYNKIPRVKNVPFIGTVTPFLSGKYHIGNITDLVKERFRTHGKIYREKFVFDDEKVYTCDPKDWETLYKSHEKVSDTNRSLWSLKAYSEKHNLPLSYVDLNGDEFLRRRDAMAKNFLQPKMIAKYVPMYSDVTDDFLVMFDKKMSNQKQPNPAGPFVVENIREHLSLWQLECSGMHSFRRRFGLLEEDQSKMVDPEAMTIMKNAKIFFELFHVVESSPIHKTKKTKEWRLYEECMNNFNNATRSLLSKYPEYLFDPDSGIPQDDVFSMMVDNLRASTDTVFHALNWGLIELSRNSDVQEKLYGEVQPVLSEAPRLSYARLQKLPYLRGCLKEIFRLRPIVPLLGKRLEHDVILSGYRIPAGKLVIVSMHHYDEEAFFNDPQRMIPERWMKNEDTVDVCPITGKIKEVAKFAILPFGHGPRACIGRRIAENLLLVFYAKFVNNYKILPVKEEIRMKYTFFHVADKNVKFRFQKR